MSQSICPPVAELLRDSALAPAVHRHLADCPACAGLVAIGSLRPGDDGGEPSPALCAAFEPLVAAMVDGCIDEPDSERLLEHLEGCARCSQVVGSLCLFRHELQRLPEPRIDGDAPPDAAVEAAPAPAAGWLALLGVGLRSLVMPRQRWLWAAELAVVATLALLAGHWLATSGSPSDVVEVPVSAQDGEPAFSAVGSTAQLPVEERRAPADPEQVRTGRKAGKGRLDVTCKPLCNAVVVDGKDYGSSPVLRLQLTAGRHRVVLKRKGRSKAVVTHIDAGKATKLVVDMTAKAGDDDASEGSAGYLSLNCKPLCKTVLIDGKSYGATPLTRVKLAPGKHVIDLTSKDARKRKTVQVRSGEVTRVVVDMAPKKSGEDKAPESAYISVACSPRCDSVKVDGKLVGPSPVVRYRVKPGKHRLALHSRNVTRPVVVLIKAGESKDLHISMEPPSKRSAD